MNEWISVNNEYPKIDYDGLKSYVRVLVSSPEKGVLIASMRHIFRFYEKGKHRFVNHLFFKVNRNSVEEGEVVDDVTHWMPLPEPQKVNE